MRNQCFHCVNRHSDFLYYERRISFVRLLVWIDPEDRYLRSHEHADEATQKNGEVHWKKN